MELKPGYKQTEAGVIPDEWSLRGLLTTVQIANGQVDPRDEPFKSMILVAPDHIESGTGKLLEKRTASEQRAISGKYRFAAGDIVYSKIRPYLRKAILADFDGLCSADMYPLMPASDVVGGFVLPVLLAHRFTKYAESVSVRSGMPKINRAEMADFVVALPPPPEQRAIATALSDVDALLGALDRLIAKKRDLKQAAMQQLLTGQTRLPGFSGEWDVKALRDVCVKIQDGTHFSPTIRGGKYLYVTSKNIGFGTLDVNDAPRIDEAQHRPIYRRCDPKRGDLLLTKDGASTGNAALNTLDEEFSLLSSVALLRFDPEVHDASYFLQQILSHGGQRRIKDEMSGNAITRLTLAKINRLRFPVCRLPEQRAIAAALSDMDAEIEALEARRAKTRDLKQAMMQELLTGKTRLVQPEAAHA